MLHAVLGKNETFYFLTSKYNQKQLISSGYRNVAVS